METIKLSLHALRSHKLRSFLTLLGVILAVTTLVAVMSVIAKAGRRFRCHTRLRIQVVGLVPILTV